MGIRVMNIKVGRRPSEMAGRAFHEQISTFIFRLVPQALIQAFTLGKWVSRRSQHHSDLVTSQPKFQSASINAGR